MYIFETESHRKFKFLVALQLPAIDFLHLDTCRTTRLREPQLHNSTNCDTFHPGLGVYFNAIKHHLIQYNNTSEFSRYTRSMKSLKNVLHSSRRIHTYDSVQRNPSHQGGHSLLTNEAWA